MKLSNDAQAQILCKKCKTLHAVNAPCPLPTEDMPMQSIETDLTLPTPFDIADNDKQYVSTGFTQDNTRLTEPVPTVSSQTQRLTANAELISTQIEPQNETVVVEIPVQLSEKDSTENTFSQARSVSAVFSETGIRIGKNLYKYQNIDYISMPYLTAQSNGKILLNYNGITYALTFHKNDFAEMQIAAVYTAEKIGQVTSSAEAQFTDSDTQTKTTSAFPVTCCAGNVINIAQTGIYDGNILYPYEEIRYITPPFSTNDGKGKILLNHNGTVLSFVFENADVAKMQIAVCFANEQLKECKRKQAEKPNKVECAQTISTDIGITAPIKLANSDEHVCPYCKQKIHKNAVICICCGADLKNVKNVNPQSAAAIPVAPPENPSSTSNYEAPEGTEQNTSSFSEALLNDDSSEPLKSLTHPSNLSKQQKKVKSAKSHIFAGILHCIMPLVWLAAPVFYLDAHYAYSPELALRVLLGDSTLPDDRYVPWELAFEDIPNNIIFYILLAVLIIGHVICAISVFKERSSKVFRVAQILPLLCSAITVFCIQTEAYYLFNGTLNDFVTLHTTPVAWLLVLLELILLIFGVKKKAKSSN